VRLETLGFRDVYDYVGGKADWRAAGLPTEGSNAHTLRAKDALRQDIATCHLGEHIGDMQRRLAVGEACFVTTADGVVLGRIGRRASRAVPDARVEDVMSPGPATFRADAALDDLIQRMARAGMTNVPITNPEGRLLGVVYRSDAEQLIARSAGT